MEDVAKKHVIDIGALKLVDLVLQAIVLDIACFFIQWKKEEVQIPETYYSNVDQNIDILKKRCLLTTNFKDQLEMNDLLRHVGRKIARNNTPDDPRKHSRLWLSIDIYGVLKKHKGTEAIQGIIPRKKDALEGESFTMETFKRMSKLRFLYLKKVDFKGSFEQAFEELRWFCWYSCPLKCLPSDFCPQQLVILELPHSNMRTFQEPNMVSIVFGKLWTLNMSYSQDLITTPDFIKLLCLENLNLGYCKSLEEIHVSIGSLVWLVSLNLHACVKLRSLPETICKITKLRRLNATLDTLLKKLPDIGSNQIALSLQELKLSCSGITALPSGFNQLSNLQSLQLSYCNHLLSIPELPPNMKEIRADCCKSLERLPNLSNLKHLRTLDLSFCSGLTEILGLEELTALRELNITDCRDLTNIQGLEELNSIRSLRLEGRDSLPAYKHLTKRLFQLFSEFGHQISVYPPEFLNWKSHPQWPDWIIESPYWTSESSKLRVNSVCTFAVK